MTPLARPTEAAEQAALIAFCQQFAGRIPELALIYHVPNGGARDGRTGARLKMQGVRAGVPDLVLPVARRSYHGLYLELKRPGGRTSELQTWWLAQLRQQGYDCAVVIGWAHAARHVLWYLGHDAEEYGL